MILLLETQRFVSLVFWEISRLAICWNGILSSSKFGKPDKFKLATLISNISEKQISSTKDYEDLIKNTGPLAGIYTGLRYSKTENNLIVSCDVPLINTVILQKLTDQKNDTSEVIQLQCQGENMPLIALYKKCCEMIFLKELVKNQRKVQKSLKKCNVKTIIIDETLKKVATNINTQKDLELLDFNLWWSP